MSDTINAMWKKEPGRLKKARVDAKQVKKDGDILSAHSIMLSAYITIAGSKEWKRWLHPIFVLWHGLYMRIKWESLNHNQLDVLIQFFLKLRQGLSKPSNKLCSDHWLVQAAKKEVLVVENLNSRSLSQIKPHQIALAYITFAEVLNSVGDTFNPRFYVEKALRLEDSIQAEFDQPQGLRQLVRIFKKSAELYMKIGKEAHLQEAENLLIKALILAKNKADCADQVPKIEKLLANFD
jgi:hypothetical protein